MFQHDLQITENIKRNKDTLLVISLVVTLVIFGSIYYEFSDDSESESLEDVTLKLKWVHQSQFAGNYVAKEMGFYEEKGLNVSLIPFSYENPTIESVADGKASFGVTGATELLMARQNGAPIKAFAVIYKTSPVCAYSLKGSGITKPYDFVGKTVGIEGGVNDTEIDVGILYKAMMEKTGINRSEVKEIPIGYSPKELLNGTTDVSTGYMINEPRQAIEKGYEVNTILMADYGANIYGDVLFAREDTLENRPELVRNFLEATLEGWRYSIRNEKKTIDFVLEYAENRTRSHERYMLEKSIPLIHTGESELGWMEEKQWERAKEILTRQEILNESVKVEDAYTMKFLNEIYNEGYGQDED